MPFQGGNKKTVIGVSNNEDDLEAAIGVGLGELAEITVNNDADPSNYDVSLLATLLDSFESGSKS